jgi:LysR family glycine cleavage system transcriptional activator
LARSVPPLNPLYVFEVASRVGNFTEAADLLGVTPSAVSRQISTLESFLNVRLFHRSREGNSLTEVGEKYRWEIAPAFQTIGTATERIKKGQDTTPLSVRVPATFATRFLIPRLSQFRAEEPGIGVRVVTGFGPVDFVREDVDVSIQVGDGEWPGCRCRALFENWAQPVCSPSFLIGRSVTSVDDLRGLRLLRSQNRRSDWPDWLAAVGRPDFPIDQSEIVEFSNSLLAYQAAVDGLGIAIGHLPLIGPDLVTKRLQPVLGQPIRQGSYYLVWRADRDLKRKARTFQKWLERQLCEASQVEGGRSSR